MEASFLQGAAAFARSLRVVNEHLTSLDLGFNEIRDKGAFALAQALKANGEAAVTTLNLSSNFFTKYGQVCSPCIHEPIAYDF
jgi:hypothetical protein